MAALGVLCLIINTGNLSIANKSNLLKLLSNSTKSTNYKWKLDISVDVGSVVFCFFFVKAAYNLDGDAPLALST